MYTSKLRAILFLTFIFDNNNVNSYEILGIFPLAVKSHFEIFDALMVALANRGHKVTVFSPFPKNDTISGYFSISLADCFSTPPIYDFGDLIFSPNFFFNIKLHLSLNPSSESILNCDPIVELFLNSSKKYDLLITETFFNDFYQFLGYKFEIPVIAFDVNFPFPWMMEWTGLPLNPSYIPCILTSFLPKMNFIERLTNTLVFAFAIIEYKFSSDYIFEHLASEIFGSSMPSLSDVRKNASLLFLNSNANLNSVIPLVPNVIEISGLHIKKAKVLPEVRIIFRVREA